MSRCSAGDCICGEAILLIANELNAGSGKITGISPSLVVDEVKALRARAEAAERERDEAQACCDRVAEIVGALHDQSMGPRFVGTHAEIVACVQGVKREAHTLRAEVERLRGALDGMVAAHGVMMEHAMPGLAILANGWLAESIEAARTALAGEAKERHPADALPTCQRCQMEPSCEEVRLCLGCSQVPGVMTLPPVEEASGDGEDVEPECGRKTIGCRAGLCGYCRGTPEKASQP